MQPNLNIGDDDDQQDPTADMSAVLPPAVLAGLPVYHVRADGGDYITPDRLEQILAELVYAGPRQDGAA